MTTKKPPAPRVQTPKGLKVFSVPIDSLHEDPANARAHPVRNLDAIKASLLEYGQQKPLVIDKSKKILAGNGLYRAAKDLGWTTISVAESDLEGLKAMGFSIADNRTQELSEWDTGVLDQQINELLANGITLESLGFDENDLNDIIPTVPMEVKEDEIPEVPKNPVAKVGDVWTLGDHRLLCGDSSLADSFGKLMRKDQGHLCFTDPPYGISYGEKNRFLNSFQKAGRNLKDIANDMLGKDELYQMLVSAFTLVREFLRDDASVYLTSPQGGELGLMMMMMASDLPVRHVLIWNKDSQNFSMGRLDYEYKHEPILYTWKKTHRFYGKGQFTNSVWDIPKPKHADLHPTMKPIEMVQNAILNSSKRDEILLDPFMGSGTSIIAAQSTERRCFGIDCDPGYVDVAIERWEQLTGQKAVREKS